MSELKILDHNASRLVTPGFRLGTESPSFIDYEKTGGLNRNIDLRAVRTFLDECMKRFGDNQTTEADVWLAPRLHYALRLSRREASVRGIWSWLGVVFAPDYVRWRWKRRDTESDKAIPMERFNGPDYKQALARLWWMAELFRDGDNYRPVCSALDNQDIPNNFFRMDLAHHRPTVQAIVRVLENRTGREANALAKAANSSATTLVFDAIGTDESPDPEALGAWLQDDADPTKYFDELPSGPNENPVSVDSVDRLVALMEKLFEEAPVRGKN